MKKSIIAVGAIILICALLLVACGKKEDGAVGNKAVSNNAGTTKGRVENALTEAGNRAGEVASDIGNAAGEVVSDAGDIVSDVATGAANAARDAVTGVGEAVSDAVTPNG